MARLWQAVKLGPCSLPGLGAKRPIWDDCAGAVANHLRKALKPGPWARESRLPRAACHARGPAQQASACLAGGRRRSRGLRGKRCRALALSAREGQSGLFFGGSGKNGGHPAAFGFHGSILFFGLFRHWPGLPFCCYAAEIPPALRQFRGDDPDFPRNCGNCVFGILSARAAPTEADRALVLLGFRATVAGVQAGLFP